MDHGGKVERISRTQGSPRESMVFGYGASGSRILKQVGADPDLGTGYREQYIRDAQGNVMAIYQFAPAPDQNTPLSFAVTQRPIYDSSRLGLDAATLELSDPNYNENDPVDNGKVRYELTDHLGNVCAVINDVAEGYSTDADPESEEWHPELLSAQEYEPFGSLLPGRNYSSDSYRFGFQGQEKDDEMHGATGTSYNYSYRMHDARVGRFLSIDPLAAKYPHNSPYAFSENKVIASVELEGLEEVPCNEAARREREGLAPILKKSEWKNEDRHSASGTFAAAASYNTSTLNSQVYEPINQIHNYYQWADSKLQAKGIDIRWFKAAEEVTDPNLGIGASQWFPASAIGGFSKGTSTFLAAGNKYLMSQNLPTMKGILETGSFNGLTGKQADYAMVEFEQGRLTEWMGMAEKIMGGKSSMV